MTHLREITFALILTIFAQPLHAAEKGNEKAERLKKLTKIQFDVT